MIKYISVLLLLLNFSCSKSKDYKNSSNNEALIKVFQKKSAGSSLDSTYFHLRQADSIIKNNPKISDSLKAENNFLIGNYYLKVNKLDSAAQYFHNATDFVIDSVYSERQGNYFVKAWDTYFVLNKFGDCLTISNRLKKLLNKDKQYQMLTWVYYFEETVYIKTKEYDKALLINKLRINLATKKDTANTINALVSKARIEYYYLNDKATAFFLLDSILNTKNININLKAPINNELGVFYYWESDFKNALKYYKRSLHYTKQLKKDLTKTKLAIKYNNITEVYLDIKKYDSAKIYLDSVKLLGINFIEQQQQYSFIKYRLRLSAATDKNFKEVTNYLDSIYTYRDKLYFNKYNNELVELTKAYQKEKELVNKNRISEIYNYKLKTRILVLIIILFLSTIIGLLIHRQRKYKFEKQSLQMQQRLLRSQMNPHFMFNTLYVIQNLIDKEPKKSTAYLIKFSRLLRLILDNSLTNYVLLEHEIESLVKYMELQLLRFPNKFTYSVNLENLEKDELLYIPPMLIQPFIENSIEHGFKNIAYEGIITIQLTLQDKYILCCIEDNGIGFDNKKINYKKSTSMDLITNFLEKSTKNKIKKINKKNQSKTETGLYIEFLIPYKLNNHD